MQNNKYCKNLVYMFTILVDKKYFNSAITVIINQESNVKIIQNK